MRSISWGEIGAPMFAWLRIIATSSMGGFNSLGGQVLPSQAPQEPAETQHQESRRGESVRLANILPATASGMNLSLGWPPKPVADRCLLSAVTNLIPLLAVVQ